MHSRLLRVGLGWIVAWLVTDLTSHAWAADADSAARSLQLLRTGEAAHAFDHLGNLGYQATAAAASGATIIYATGLGGVGYSGLPAPDALEQLIRTERDYAGRARREGIQVVLAYQCATSIVGLERFDQHWSAELRDATGSPPADWLQQDHQGRPLPSWYGGEYRPACMNHPGWRAYQRHLLRLQFEAGHDGIFFDNPTVHPQGCYCPHCLARFADHLVQHEGVSVSDRSIEALRTLTDQHPAAFARFRCTIARDFFAEMRTTARRIRPDALLTANNSLNSAEALYAQCRTHAYNLAEMSRSEDFVVVEDMANQPRVASDGRLFEYGPNYRQLHSILHGKPLVAVTIAEGDYHTPPNLVRLALGEAAAHDASYLIWTTWPEAQQSRLAAATRAEVEFLRRHARYLQDTTPRADVLLFLPFRRWVETPRCTASTLATALTRSNVQFAVVSDEDFTLSRHAGARVLLTESRSVFNAVECAAVAEFEARGGEVLAADTAPDWLARLTAPSAPATVHLKSDPAVRCVVRDQGSRTLVHLLNLRVQRRSSFEDHVTPATNLVLRLRVPVREPRTVRVLSADAGATQGSLTFRGTSAPGGTEVQVDIPRVDVHSLVVVE